MSDKTDVIVIFKMTPTSEYNPNSECIAFLMDVPANDGMVMSYMTIGQHGEASLAFMTDCTLATEEEYSSLKEELESIGYYVTNMTEWLRTKRYSVPENK